MLKTLKELKREMDARIGEEEIVRDGEGRAVIEMRVRNDDDFLSDLSDGKSVIAEEVADFLHDSMEAFAPKENLHLVIKGDCISEEEGMLYTNAIREHATVRYKKVKRDLKRNSFISAILALIGTLGVVAMLLVTFLADFSVIGELLDIFAWVFVWEAVDLFFLERRLMVAERTRCLRLFDAVIEFQK